jgi:predicted Zn-dependent protease
MAPAERAALVPYRIRTIALPPGASVESLARLLPYPDHRRERLRILNGLKPDEEIAPGATVKLVEGR